MVFFLGFRPPILVMVPILVFRVIDLRSGKFFLVAEIFSYGAEIFSDVWWKLPILLFDLNKQ
jgi:hypothetical protein